jgi:hypothetical protein
MTAPRSGKIYDISHLQFFQGDAVRGYGGVNTPSKGRRLLARTMHGTGVGPTPGGAPAGSVAIAADGSTAAFVPARRALTWQLTAPDGAAVVRERNWVTFAPGEIRVCASCHGLNKMNQAGAPTSTNPPEALRKLVQLSRAEAGPAMARLHARLLWCQVDGDDLQEFRDRVLVPAVSTALGNKAADRAALEDLISLAALVPEPAGVVTTMRPLVAPEGTVAVILTAELTVKAAAAPLNVTDVAPVKLAPLIVTTVPAPPAIGEKLVTRGPTAKAIALVTVPPGAVTLIGPVVALAGTVPVI